MSDLRANHVGVAAIGDLFFLRCPAAILRRVWAVVVDAVNRIAFSWPWPHVVKEIQEAGEPSFADANAATAVETINPMVCIVATAFHPGPCGVFGRPAGTSRRAVFNARCAHFELQTTTTALPCLAQISAANDAKVSAVALAFPKNTATLRTFRQAKDYQATIPTARQVNQLRHRLILPLLIMECSS